MRCHATVIAGLATVLTAGTVYAHGRSISYSIWRSSDAGVVATIKVAAVDATIFAAEAAASRSSVSEVLARQLAAGVSVAADGERCPATAPPRAIAGMHEWRSFELAFHCPSSDSLTIRVEVLFDRIVQHVHLARIETDRGSTAERVLTATSTSWTTNLDTQGSGPSPRSFLQYVELGIDHILSGYDHLAFVAALLLLAASIGEVALLASAFTVAHSITLAAAVLGWVRTEPRVVESLIAFSIALVAVENTWLVSGRGRMLPVVVVAALLALALAASAQVILLPMVTLLGLGLFSACHFGLMQLVDRPACLRALVAFCFGLIHGFGFAGVLAELGLEAERLMPALLGFNAGVELGQLAVILLAWPLLSLAARSRIASREAIAAVGSAAICGLGVFWFLVRAAP